MLNEVVNISKEAGKIVLEYYDKGYNTFFKDNNTPFTTADRHSSEFLMDALRQIKDIPVLSEENICPYETRMNWQEFWLIDPLDGTQEFIHGQDEFCINIAWIWEGKPMLGVIYAPVTGELYMAEKHAGFNYQGPPRKIFPGNKIVAGISRFHRSATLQTFVELNKLENLLTLGAAIKFGRLAVGEINLYPRFMGSKEWDTAAGQIIIEEAGCKMWEIATLQSMIYNKEYLENGYFIAHSSQVNISSLKIPGLKS